MLQVSSENQIKQIPITKLLKKYTKEQTNSIREHNSREADRPVKNIEGHVYTSMANVAEIVGGDSTNVHPHFTIRYWFEGLLLPRHRVVKPQRRRFRKPTELRLSSECFVNRRLGRTVRSEGEAARGRSRPGVEEISSELNGTDRRKAK